jgi:hypothetical protein
MIFQARLYYFHEGIGENHFDIIYDSDGKSSAVSDVYRWAQDRKRCLPYIFGNLIYVKIAEYPIDKIEKDGSLKTGMCCPFYEWKVDFPYPFDGKFEKGG